MQNALEQKAVVNIRAVPPIKDGDDPESHMDTLHTAYWNGVKDGNELLPRKQRHPRAVDTY